MRGGKGCGGGNELSSLPPPLNQLNSIWKEMTIYNPFSRVISVILDIELIPRTIRHKYVRNGKKRGGGLLYSQLSVRKNLLYNLFMKINYARDINIYDFRSQLTYGIMSTPAYYFQNYSHKRNKNTKSIFSILFFIFKHLIKIHLTQSCSYGVLRKNKVFGKLHYIKASSKNTSKYFF